MARHYSPSEYEREDEPTGPKLKTKVILCIILILFGFGSIAYSSYMTDSTNEETEKLQADLEDKQKELLALQSQDGDVNVKEISVQINNATEQGEKLCKIQNKLNKLSNNGDLGDSDEYQGLLKELRTYVSESDGNDTNSIAKWCGYGKWEFTTTYDYAGTEVPVMWMCYNKKDKNHDKLLCCVIGTYDSVNDVFKNMTVQTTSYVNDYIEATDDSEDVTIDEVDDSNTPSN